MPSIYGQVRHLNSLTFDCDTLTRENFYKAADNFHALMRKNEKFTIQQVLSLVRIYNTLHMVDVAKAASDKTFPKKFIMRFERDYLKAVAEQLEYTYGKGMTMYSPKYDLFIGAASNYRCKDYYTIQ
jgi:hypothetical protein